jgi:glycosyltransferase involved in cell wall biosynthesis
MLVSVFTPSHNPAWLPDVWACLQEQTYQDWEWVVVANGDQSDLVATTVEHITQGDGRVRLLRSNATNIGALKRFACDHAVGDLLLEYDHDDLITHDCLEEVVAAAQRCPRLCFIWSDDVSCNMKHESQCYSPAWGWRQFDWSYKGRDYKVNEHHPIGPRSLCEILYAPDHVRVWSREAYRLVGGHNPDLPVADDHELLIRTYLKGIHFEHIHRPLYFHRQNGQTTCQVRVEEIQRRSREHRDRWLHDLVREWCRREKLPMYDLGGAHNCPDGYIPIDIDPAVKKHPLGIQCDVLQPEGLFPYLKPNSVGCFRAFDFLEHIPANRVPWLMNHLYDLLVPGGFLLTHTPAVCDDSGRCGRGAYQDPTHVSFWSSNNFWYVTDRNFAKYVPEIRCRFQAVRLSNGYPSAWHHMHLIPYVDADLCALKEENSYWPGPKFI